jgi:hypothetical protein
MATLPQVVSWEPRIVVVDGFLREQEADALVNTIDRERDLVCATTVCAIAPTCQSPDN